MAAVACLGLLLQQTEWQLAKCMEQPYTGLALSPLQYCNADESGTCLKSS